MEDKKERWIELCEQATTEQDSVRLSNLAAEICALLDEKEARLLEARHKARPVDGKK